MWLSAGAAAIGGRTKSGIEAQQVPGVNGDAEGRRGRRCIASGIGGNGSNHVAAIIERGACWNGEVQLPESSVVVLLVDCHMRKIQRSWQVLHCR